MAQRHDANWVYTESVLKDSTIYLLTFDNKTDTFHLLKSPIKASTSASYSDAFGNFRCFSNGYQMYSSDFSLMENGDSLGFSYTWDSIPLIFSGGDLYSGEFLSFPGHGDNKAVLFQLVRFQFSTGFIHKELWYSIVDLEANDGKGKVIEKNIVLCDSVYHFTIIKHANGKDWWLICMKDNLIEFETFLLSESGIQLESNQSFALPVYFSLYTRSPLVSSPKGDWIFRQFNHQPGYLFHFNRCTGEIQFQTEVGIPDTISVPNSFGMAMPIGSPNGRFIYSIFHDQVTIQSKKFARPRLMQADLESENPSFQFLTHIDLKGDGISYPQQSPHGEIFYMYNTKEDLYSLITIHRPDDLLDDCGLEIPGKAFPSGFKTNSTPRFPNYRLGPLVGSECDTVTTSVAVPEMGKTYDMMLTPNPSSGPVDVEITLPEYQGHHVQFDVFNALGVKVSSHTFPPFSYRYTLDTSLYGSGMYTIHLVVDGQVVRTEKLVVVGR
ncbi:MAG: T9SS type A sorting domain-containing protein [Saprospiraceae bacterium]|nr:T9SS type A sorting domain-containing protein [Saprospiraceae bacterium]